MTSPDRIPLLIDTDTAADDCFALLVALLHPKADLTAVTIVGGNVDFAQQTDNAFLTLGLAGRLGEVPVYAGASEPLRRERVGAEEVQADGVGGLRRGEREVQIEDAPAWQAMIAAAREHPGRLVVVAIGPLTNLALAVQHDPEFASLVQRVVVMGGSINGRGNVTPVAEYNIYVDPDATQIVLHAGFAQLDFVPWDPVCVRDAVCTADDLGDIEAIGTPLSRFFLQANAAPYAFDTAHGIPGSTHCDTLSVLFALEPEIGLDVRPYRVSVETESRLTLGVTVFDSEQDATVEERHPNARGMLSADRALLLARLAEALSARPERQVLPHGWQ